MLVPKENIVSYQVHPTEVFRIHYSHHKTINAIKETTTIINTINKIKEKSGNNSTLIYIKVHDTVKQKYFEIEIEIDRESMCNFKNSLLVLNQC